MAKQKKIDYSAEVKNLKANGPARLYLLYGEEDYLVESFASELKTQCLSAENQEFNYRRLGEDVTPQVLSEAVEALPFLSERTYIEIRSWDINKCREKQADEMKKILEDIPDYCTIAIILDTNYEPDSRIGVIKTIKKCGTVLAFSAQNQMMLTRWISRRFQVYGKKIGKEEAEYLIYVSGGFMHHMVSEIEKLSSYVSEEWVTKEAIDAVVQRLPEADVFEMTECISVANYDKAMELLAELLAQQEAPIKLLAIIGQQFRRLYDAKVSMMHQLSSREAMELCGVRFEFILQKLYHGARKFTNAQLISAVTLCAETDYAMKTTGKDNGILLQCMLMKLAAGGSK